MSAPSDQAYMLLAIAVSRADYHCKDCPTGRLAGLAHNDNGEPIPWSAGHAPTCPQLVPGSIAQEIGRLDVLDSLAAVLGAPVGDYCEEVSCD